MDRYAALAILSSLSGLPFLFPHVIEDFQLGIAQRVGLSTEMGAALLGLGFAGQMLGLVWAGQGRRPGLVVTALAGAIWAGGALVDHGPDLYASSLEFRSGAPSVLWVSGLLVSQALSSALAIAALARRRRA